MKVIDSTHVILNFCLKFSIISFLYFFQQGVGSGVLRGIACQKFGAIVNFISYYCINLLIGIPLLLKTSVGVPGRLLCYFY